MPVRENTNFADYPMPWTLVHFPSHANPFIIAANNKPLCQIPAEPGAALIGVMNKAARGKTVSGRPGRTRKNK